jgi:DNA-binding transcriptional MerR regulator
MMAHTVSIGQVAKKTGVAAKTIRYYEQIGVLPRPGRTISGYRQYDESAVERLRFISRARSLGLPLQRLRVLAGTLNGGPRRELRPELLALVQQQLVAVQHRITELETLRGQLEQVSHRMLSSTPRRRTGTCRCLETTDAIGGSPKREAGQHQRS